MAAFENKAIAFVPEPSVTLVYERLCRDEPCKGEPLSRECTLARAEVVTYLVRDTSPLRVCRHCPKFAQKLEQLKTAWEEWIVEGQERFS